ncbi:MAG TPA: metalloregulator ArsR/SmtB family transcription factor [Candidatus Aquilonibacter sp.]|nr:metalloregulator ArsR/SmtB family transcription factor [Candidatus Aquilonibacter sp.]
MSIQRCCPPASVVEADFEPAASLLKAIADPYRLTMLATLASAKDEVCVCDFTDALPLNQPTVSHHLRILREAALVTSERRGTWVYYRIASDAQSRIREALTSIFKQKVPQ